MACVKFLALLIALCAPLPSWAASRPPVRATTGMVAADTEAASRAGLEMLEEGGSAADAAVATALALGVASPAASGLGGGGFALYYDGGTGRVVVLDFREVAPAGINHELFLADGVPMPSEASRFTGLSVGVPGEIAGLWALHQRFGRLPWRRVCEPAIRLAEEGFVVGYPLSRSLTHYRGPLLARPALMRPFTTESGELAEVGDIVRRPNLARTLRAIAEQGPEAFYSGPVAEAIASAVQSAGGAMTVEDLAAYQVAERSPVVGDYRGFTIIGMPPPSSGATTILAALEVLEGFDLPALGHNGSAHLHRVAEALQFGFADRAVFVGDPAGGDIPIDGLIDPGLGERRRSLFDPDQTLPTRAYGQAPPPPDDSGTSHFSVVDVDRNIVALTTTVNFGFGSMLIAGDTGIILNNELNDFSADPWRVSPDGERELAANAPRPGTRPMSSMSPTLVLRDGQPWIVTGGSGGPAIISATLQVLLNVIDFGLTAREAVEAPRIHHQWQPPVLFAEAGVPEDVRENLRRRGHEVSEPPWLPSVQVILIDGGALYGASDPRKDGVTVGY